MRYQVHSITTGIDALVTLRSRRPGRMSAGSNVSIRFVAMMTFTLTDWSNPSIWFNNSSRIRCTSLSAPVCESKRLVPMASIWDTKQTRRGAGRRHHVEGWGISHTETGHSGRSRWAWHAVGTWNSNVKRVHACEIRVV